MHGGRQVIPTITFYDGRHPILVIVIANLNYVPNFVQPNHPPQFQKKNLIILRAGLIHTLDEGVLLGIAHLALVMLGEVYPGGPVYQVGVAVALLYLLSHPIAPLPQSSSKFPTKITTIFSKLFNRILTEEIENVSGRPFRNVDLPVITYALNDFFSVYPRRERGSETQYDAAAGLLKKMALHVGSDEIVSIVNSTLPGAKGRPLLAAMAAASFFFISSIFGEI